MKISAVFLDRDGVLNPHIPGGYLLSADELVVLPGVAQAVRRLNDAGLPVIVISNQQGVGKGMMTRDDLTAIERRMDGGACGSEAGARIERCYYSTELASANSPRRKPGPGMLLEAAEDFGLNLPETVFAGDSPTDIQAGHAGGRRRDCFCCSPAGHALHAWGHDARARSCLPRHCPTPWTGYWSKPNDYCHCAGSLRPRRQPDRHVRRQRPVLFHARARPLLPEHRLRRHHHHRLRPEPGH